MLSSFPFITQKQSIALLRIAVAIVFLLHALIRIYNGSIDGFAEFMNDKGFRYGTPIVWMLTIYEIACSILLALNYRTRLVSLGFIVILLTGIVIIHASLGWFVGEHGTGGVEYSFILIMALIAIAASDAKK